MGISSHLSRRRDDGFFAGRGSDARALLGSLDQPVSPALSATVARQWLRAGDSTRARLALARVDVELSALEHLLGEILLTRDEPRAVLGSLRELLAAVPYRQGKAEDIALASLMAAPDRRVAEQVSAAFLPAAAKTDDTIVSALWLYCSLAGAERDTAIWAAELGRRFGKWPIRIRENRLDEKTALFVLNSFPLSRELIDGILDAVTVGRGAAAASRWVSAPAPTNGPWQS